MTLVALVSPGSSLSLSPVKQPSPLKATISIPTPNSQAPMHTPRPSPVSIPSPLTHPHPATPLKRGPSPRATNASSSCTPASSSAADSTRARQGAVPALAAAQPRRHLHSTMPQIG
eukprot:5870292-Pleurochrysis_carterae.AAC.1